MGFLAWLRGESKREASDHLIGPGYSFFYGTTSSWRAVTERSAMQMTAVYTCVRILAEAIAGLPLYVYQQSADGAKVKATTDGSDFASAPTTCVRNRTHFPAQVIGHQRVHPGTRDPT
ncbi:hypothetical protein [Gleimia hominis]|uniref:hypothetical protein n=1 Tax=Gleimia hominis TaxID=595468 RepID=UPI0025428456|nr:hypothetical protein [Gleimia hominis]WIK65059.1 hypothetical protein CJ187_003125 [Gleimia hominis]